MKKRYFYTIASFMRKDIEDIKVNADFTVMKDDDSAFFPLMRTIEAISKKFRGIANISTIQFESYFEISKEDYEAFNKFKDLNKVNVDV